MDLRGCLGVYSRNMENSPSVTIEKPRANYLEVKADTMQSIVHEIESEIENAGEIHLTYTEVIEKFLDEVKSRPYDPVKAQENHYRNQILIKLFECFKNEEALKMAALDVERRKDELRRISPAVENLFKEKKNIHASGDKFLTQQVA